MRYFTILVSVVIAVALVCTLVGCSRTRTAIVPGGKVTVKEKGGEAAEVQVKTDKGTATYSSEKRSITEKELGVPVYPGAVVEFSGSSTSTQPGESQSLQNHMLTTKDSFEKVAEFYKANLKNVEGTVEQSAGDSQMAMFTLKKEKGVTTQINVVADKDKKQTNIQVMRIAGS